MTRYRLDIAYDGTAYRGFALQPGHATIQGELEKALSVLCRAQVSVEVAGRTDAGVHALRQVVAFTAPSSTRDLAIENLAGLLPEDIRPLELATVDDGFDPRRDALAREYLYLLARSPAPLIRHLVWERRGPLDFGRIVEAARALVGTHDFTSFCLADAPAPHVRHLMALDLEIANVAGAEVIVVRAVANAFLHGMVRALVGSLVDVGRGHREPDRIGEVLAAKKRRMAGPAAPARGLILARVYYTQPELDETLSRGASWQLTMHVPCLDSSDEARL